MLRMIFHHGYMVEERTTRVEGQRTQFGRRPNLTAHFMITNLTSCERAVSGSGTGRRAPAAGREPVVRVVLGSGRGSQRWSTSPFLDEKAMRALTMVVQEGPEGIPR